MTSLFITIFLPVRENYNNIPPACKIVIEISQFLSVFTLIYTIYLQLNKKGRGKSK